jgi:hypothetical protein
VQVRLLIPMAKTRMIVPRDTTLHSTAEIKRRLAFLCYVLSAPVGGLALATGIVRKQPILAVIGGLVLGLFVALYLTRSRWGMKILADEIAKNPFKAPRAPKDEDSGLL